MNFWFAALLAFFVQAQFTFDPADAEVIATRLKDVPQKNVCHRRWRALRYEGTGQGVVDNWSGASLLPSIYEGLSSKKMKHTFRFVGFTDEEKGLIGSRHYVSKLSKDEVSQMQAMINIDTVGLGPASVWLSRADNLLANGYARQKRCRSSIPGAINWIK